METKNNQVAVDTTSNKDGMSVSSIISNVKWFISNITSKGKNDSWANRTRAFSLTQKDSKMAWIFAVVVVIWAIVYGFIVMNQYWDINSNTDKLRQISTYDVSVNNSVLEPYVEGGDMNTIAWMIAVNDNVRETLNNRNKFKEQQKSYYESLLQNIYLPSLNVWKDPYTKEFDISILWQKYLDKDKFQPLYLIQYWSDFIKYVWNDADYNTIDSIVVEDMVEVEDSNYFYVPISVSFSSPNKRSFLLLVNKLSMTSNSNNIALLNEFFFYLLMNIKENKANIVENLMQEYWADFSSSSNWDWPENIWDMTEEELSDYEDKVIWYNIYKWIDGELENQTSLIDNDVIVETIRENALCDTSTSNSECFYSFREKYRNLPYLAYKIWLEYQTNRTQWLLEFLKDLPSIIAITDFGFEKYSNSSFLNNEQEQYEWTLKFNAYGRTISQDELNEAAQRLWELCFGKWSEQSISVDMALSRVNQMISSLWGSDDNINVSSLWELEWVFKILETNYAELTNYDKMIKLFEIWRMLNDANLCNV